MNILSDNSQGELCSICGIPAKHKVHDKYHRRAYVCCEHYQIIFGKNSKYCEHDPEQKLAEKGPDIIIKSIYKGYNVTAVYKWVPEDVARLKREQITKILVESMLRRQGGQVPDQ